MDVLTSIPALRAWRARTRTDERRVALVATMGALHEGHLRLIDAARERAAEVVVSVFVNPLQFGPHEDLERYPRTLEADQAAAAARGATVMFVPTVAAMYPTPDPITLQAGELATRWEGASRPGHFNGMLTVVLKLLHLVEPDCAVFGQKDYQQLALIRRMVSDLDLAVEIVAVPIVRDSDGVALSSRNRYLSRSQRAAARALPAALAAAQTAWQVGERRPEQIRIAMAAVLDAESSLQPDYIAIVDPVTMTPVTEAVAGTVVAVAARVGATRLIDNVILGEGHS